MVAPGAPDTLRAFVEEQLAGLDELAIRPMFGGHGMYSAGVFFGILSAGERLYFKTDARTRPAYEARGMGPFRPGAKMTLKSYWEVPAEVIEDGALLTAWAREAVACQERAAAKSRRPGRPQRKQGRGERGKK